MTPGRTAVGTGRVLGVDAAGRHGWIGIVVDEFGYVGAETGSLRDLVRWAAPVAAIGVDIPIGHVPDGVRQADVEARAFVGPRRSSVFAAPPAEAIAVGLYADANEALRRLGVPLMSRQAWALVPKIVEAAEVAAEDRRVHEVHPEVSFCELAGEHLQWSKKSWNGLQRRRRLLAAAGIELPDVLPALTSVVADDVVDAAVVAWSARRIATGAARTLPDPPEQGDGRRVAIWV